jgi:hypothetical protein
MARLSSRSGREAIRVPARVPSQIGKTVPAHLRRLFLLHPSVFPDVPKMIHHVSGNSNKKIWERPSRSAVSRLRLHPTRLQPFPFDGCCGIFGRQSSMTRAVLFCFSTHLHELGGGLRDIKSPVERRHAPGEISAAGIRAGVAVIVGGTLQATIIVQPFSGANGSFASAGDTGGVTDAGATTCSAGATIPKDSSWEGVMILPGTLSAMVAGQGAPPHG